MGSCPPWDDRIPDDRLSEFKALLDRVQREIFSSAAERILNDSDACRWHRTLFHRFVPLDYYAGNFRQVDPTRPCLQQRVRVGTAYGWHWHSTPEAVQRLFREVFADLAQVEIRWKLLAERDRVLTIAQLVATLVGGFIRVHPFINGNGRVSRLLWRWMLYRFGVSPQHTVFPRPGPPYSQLMAAAMEGNYLPLAAAVIEHLARNRPQQVSPDKPA